MISLLDDDSSSESDGDHDDLVSSREDLLSQCPTLEVRRRARAVAASRSLRSRIGGGVRGPANTMA